MTSGQRGAKTDPLGTPPPGSLFQRRSLPLGSLADWASSGLPLSGCLTSLCRSRGPGLGHSREGAEGQKGVGVLERGSAPAPCPEAKVPARLPGCPSARGPRSPGMCGAQTRPRQEVAALPKVPRAGAAPLAAAETAHCVSGCAQTQGMLPGVRTGNAPEAGRVVGEGLGSRL